MNANYSKIFTDWEEVQPWLKTLKREEYALFIARALLRVFPVLGTYKLGEEKHIAALLPMFRAASVPWYGGTWASLDARIEAVAKAASKSAAAANARSVPPLTDLIYGNDNRDIMVTEAFDRAVKFITPTTPDRLIRNFKAAGVAAIAADKTALDSGATVAKLSAMPLWPNGKIADLMEDFWIVLRSRLPGNEDWDVWTDWYEDRLEGTPANKELEQARVLIPDEDWEQGPAHVNAIIKRLIDEHQGFDFKNLQKIAANAETSRLGSPEELKARAKVGERAEAVEAALPKSPEYGGIGHNRPPEEIQLRKNDLSIARESVAAIREEAQAEMPNIERIAQNAFHLQQIIEHMSGRLNMTIDEFCKAYGARLGHWAAEGTVLGIVALLGIISYWLGFVIG